MSLLLAAVALAATSAPADFGIFSVAPEMVSKSANGDYGGDQASMRPKLAGNGRFVFFESTAVTLDPHDAVNDNDVYVLDRVTQQLEVVDVGDGNANWGIDVFLTDVSSNGRYVAFTTANGKIVDGVTGTGFRGYVHDRVTGQTVLASATSKGKAIDGDVWDDSLSGNGRYYAFTTSAPNVVPGVAGGVVQAYVRDLKTHKTELVSVDAKKHPCSAHCFTPRVSNDGKLVFFTTPASDLVEFDGNGTSDVFVRDRKKKETTRVSFGLDAELAAGCIDYVTTPNGRWMLFATDGDVIGDGGAQGGVYVRDLKTGAIRSAGKTPAGTTPGGSQGGNFAISKNGRYAIFASWFTSIVTPDPSDVKRDVFYADVKTGEISIASPAQGGAGIDADCQQIALSSNGKTIAFTSTATNVAPQVTWGKYQVYVNDK